MFPVKQNTEFFLKSTPKLKQFSEFVLKWQKSINLISPYTVPDIWKRHVVDSAQIYPFLSQDARILVDMGSGAGFPGIVLAILNQENKGPIGHFYLIESDIKKCIFLKEAVRIFALPVTVLNERAEKVTLEKVDVVTARALKNVNELLKLGGGFITPDTTCFFLKGEKVDEELAAVTYKMHVEKIQSQTSPEGCLLKLTHIDYNNHSIQN